MTFVALAYFSAVALPILAAFSWCEWMERHERARRERARDLLHTHAADEQAENEYRQAIRRAVNQPLGKEPNA